MVMDARTLTRDDVTRPAKWEDHAACNGLDREAFFPDKDDASDSTSEILELCNRCPVRMSCLEHALSLPEEYGIWGGTTEWDRRKLRSKRRRVMCPGCGSRGVLDTFTEHLEVCSSCGLSWQV